MGAVELADLPEHETAVCAVCGRPAMILGDECQCPGCGYRWRWPAVVGMD